MEEEKEEEDGEEREEEREEMEEDVRVLPNPSTVNEEPIV